MSSELYDKGAVTLKVVEGVRYGFIQGHHGATFVKAAASEDAVERSAVAADPHLVAMMATALERLPRNALGEGAFYLFLAALALLGAPYLSRRVCGSSRRDLRRALVAGALAAASMFVFLAPRTVLGYGWSAFTTWAGPYPQVYSGPYARFSGVPGETVSYRYVQEVLVLPAIAFGNVLVETWGSVSKSLAGLTVLELLHIGGPDETRGAVLYWAVVLGLPFLATAAITYVLAKRRSA